MCTVKQTHPQASEVTDKCQYERRGLCHAAVNTFSLASFREVRGQSELQIKITI